MILLQDAVKLVEQVTLSGAFDAIVKLALVLVGFVGRGIFRRLDEIKTEVEKLKEAFQKATLDSHGRLTALETARKLTEE